MGWFHHSGPCLRMVKGDLFPAWQLPVSIETDHPLKKTLATIALAATLTSVGAGVAHANEGYPAPAPPSTVSQGSIEAGKSVTFTGSGFTPGEEVVITAEAAPSLSVQVGSRAVASRVALAPVQLSTVADAAGKFSIEVQLSEAGTFTLTAKGLTSGVTVSNTVVVQAPAASVASDSSQPSQSSPQGQLPYMGADPALLLWGVVGAGAVAAGTVSILLVKRGEKAVTS